MNTKRYPEPTVGICIINPEGKLFLMKSYKWKDTWVMPGGHIELGETINDAIKREAKEETSLSVYDPEFICIWEFINEDEFITKKHMIFLDYVVKTNDKVMKLNSEGQEYKWVTQEEALMLSLEKYTKMTIEQYSEKIFK